MANHPPLASTVASVPQASTNIAAGSGVTNDSIQPSAQEHKLSPTGVNGFRDFDPEVVVPGFGSAAASPDPTSYYESLVDLTGAGVASNETRKLSPTGTNGFRDFDPSVVYSPAIVAFEAFPGANQVAAYPAETR